MIVGRLHHIGVFTPSIEASITLYRDLVGATHIGEPVDLPAEAARVCFVNTPNAEVELIEPLEDHPPFTVSSPRTWAGC